MGIGWRHNVQSQLVRDDGSASLVQFLDETGRQRDFERVDSAWQLKSDSLFDQLTLTEVGSGLWRLVREPDGRTMEFQDQGDSPIVSRLVRIVDSSDNPVEYVFNEDQQLTAIREPVSELWS